MHPRKDRLRCDARCPRLDLLPCQVDTRRKRAYHVCMVSFVLGERASALCLHGRLRVGTVFSPCIRHERNRLLPRGCGKNRRTIRGPFLEDSDALRFSLSGGSLAQNDGRDRLKPDPVLRRGDLRARGKSPFIRSGGPKPRSVAPPFDSLRIGGSQGENTRPSSFSRESPFPDEDVQYPPLGSSALVSLSFSVLQCPPFFAGKGGHTIPATPPRVVDGRRAGVGVNLGLLVDRPCVFSLEREVNLGRKASSFHEAATFSCFDTRGARLRRSKREDGCKGADGKERGARRSILQGGNGWKVRAGGNGKERTGRGGPKGKGHGNVRVRDGGATRKRRRASRRSCGNSGSKQRAGYRYAHRMCKVAGRGGQPQHQPRLKRTATHPGRRHAHLPPSRQRRSSDGRRMS